MELSRSAIVKWSKKILPVVLGAVGGYAYYHYVGCVNGACPLTGNPYITTLYGGAVGAMLIPRTKDREREGAQR